MRPIVGAVVSLALTGAVTAAMIGTASAADYYTVASPLDAYSWAGPYLGVSAGYEWATVRNNPTRPSGFASGIEAGYNWHNGAFIFGGETDISLSATEDTVSPWQFSNPWFGTVRGRAGFAMGNVLIFGTAGVAYGELRGETATLAQEGHTSVGFTGGGGIEIGLTPRWSAKAEWLYLNLMNTNFAVTGTSNALAANLLRFGLNYHF